MKRVIVVQARTTSTRFPGKVLQDLDGRPMLAQQLRRLAACRQADAIAVATTVNASDDPVAALAREAGVECVRGDERDVLGRYVVAACATGADVVVRVTGDCPLIEPAVVDRVIRELLDHPRDCDYASNVERRTFPQGLDVEALYIDTLHRVDRLAQSPASREHVTWLIRSEWPELFLRRLVVDHEDNSDLRWTVDEPDDLEMVRALWKTLALGERTVGFRDVVAYVRQHEWLAKINAHVVTPAPPGPASPRRQARRATRVTS